MSMVKTKNGDDVVIREAMPEDATQLLAISRAVMEEERYMVMRTEEFNLTVEEEKQWIEEHTDKTGFIIFVAEMDKKVIGFINFMNGTRKNIEHRGSFGMSVEKSMRGLGVGQLLIRRLLEWAEYNPIVEKVGLSVFADNHRAIQLYKKFGFIKEGHRKNEIKQTNGQYMDDILMYKLV